MLAYSHICAILLSAGPSIAFLIRLSFTSGYSGQPVTAPVFWQSNYLTLRSNEMARVCVVAGACVLLLLRDLSAVDTSNRLLPVTCTFCRFLIKPFAPARCLRIQQLSDAMHATLDAHTAKGANIQSFLYRASLRMMYM
jgi:hypothetical protein